MKIKTVGELRELIALNEGEIRIGNVSIRTIQDRRGDVDIYVDDALIGYFSSMKADECPIDGISHYCEIDDNSIHRLNRRIGELNDKILEKKEIAGADIELAKSNSKLEGKVEAYESILHARALTVSA